MRSTQIRFCDGDDFLHLIQAHVQWSFNATIDVGWDLGISGCDQLTQLTRYVASIMRGVGLLGVERRVIQSSVWLVHLPQFITETIDFLLLLCIVLNEQGVFFDEGLNAFCQIVCIRFMMPDELFARASAGCKNNNPCDGK